MFRQFIESTSKSEMLEALSAFLKSADWKDYVSSFVKSNCELFRVHSSEEHGFTHEQYSTWKNFQEIGEQVLEGVLSDMQQREFGGGMKALEEELDRISTEEPTGPRDEVTKELLAQLLTFDSFPNFAYMMHLSSGGGGGSGVQAAGITNSVSSNDTGSLAKRDEEIALVAMGFPPELVCLVLESAPPDMTLDGMVEVLSDMGSGRATEGPRNIVISPRR